MMKSADLALVLTGVMLNAAAQLLLKAGSRAISGVAFSFANGWTLAERIALNPPILAGLACYVVSVVFWILALSRVDVSVAYPMLSIGYVVNALAAWLLLRTVYEKLPPLPWTGVPALLVAAVCGKPQRHTRGRHFHHHCRRVAGGAQLTLRRFVTVPS